MLLLRSRSIKSAGEPISGSLLRGKSWHDARMRKPRRLDDAYRFTGFRPGPTVRGVFGDPKARILRLLRPGKKRDFSPNTTAHLRGLASFSLLALRLGWPCRL